MAGEGKEKDSGWERRWREEGSGWERRGRKEGSGWEKRGREESSGWEVALSIKATVAESLSVISIDHNTSRPQLHLALI